MCGIITAIKRKDDGVSTPATILGMLQSQITRGQDGFGYVAFDDIVEGFVRRETKQEIERPLGKCNARSIMFHHRLPTSTPNYADCAHPIKISHKELTYDYYVVHNGMISNHSILHDKHVELGYVYQTTVQTVIKTLNTEKTIEKWNDSEAFAIDIARYIEAKNDKIESRGSIAFVALQVKKKDNKVVRVFFGRNNNPLTINITKDVLILRSEGEKVDIEQNILYSLDIKTWKVEQTEVQIGEIMSVYNNSTKWDYDQDEDDYRSTHHTTIKLSDEDRQIANSWLNTELRNIDDAIQENETKLDFLYDGLEYYKESGNVDMIKQQEKEINKLESEICLYEEQRAELLDETLDEHGYPTRNVM